MALDRRQYGSYMPLRDAIDRLFAGSIIAPEMVGTGSGFPPADLSVTDDDVVVCMAIPGANPHDINVNVAADTLTISGEVKHSWHSGQKQSGSGKGQQSQSSQQSGQSSQGRNQPQTYIEEMWHGRFQRTFTLPTQVQADKASADFENGVLKVTLPKSEATKPRKIQVQPQHTVEGQSGSQDNQGSQNGQQSDQNVPVQSGSSS